MSQSRCLTFQLSDAQLARARDPEVSAPSIGKSSAMAASRSSWSWRVLKIIGQLQLARLRDVPIY